jgi:penicillin G amidase
MIMKNSIHILLLILCSIPRVAAGPKADYGEIELLRDTWGIAHVFSDTDAGAMYGLGYATAEDRGFQMNYNLRSIQGRLAEMLGEVKMINRNETSVDHDRKMRTFGFYRAARIVAANLDRDTLGLLEAYCEGVNASFADQKSAGRLNPLFDQFGITPERWAPASRPF